MRAFLCVHDLCWKFVLSQYVNASIWLSTLSLILLDPRVQTLVLILISDIYIVLYTITITITTEFDIAH